MVEEALLESRMRLCRQMVEETVLERSWESLEITRIVNEVKDGGMERMNKVEAKLRDRETRGKVGEQREDRRPEGR